MQDATVIRLQRDCGAVEIPSGASALLSQGTTVSLTQSLGGAFTVRAGANLYSIAGKDADALGMEPVAAQPEASAGGPPKPVEEKTAWEVLRTCFDPEIPVNIVDLGLIYDLQIEPLPSGRSKVSVKMTLTAPGCGMGTYIAADAEQKLLQTDGVEQATVSLVWDPPWHPSMISEEARRVLGLE